MFQTVMPHGQQKYVRQQPLMYVCMYVRMYNYNHDAINL